MGSEISVMIHKSSINFCVLRSGIIFWLIMPTHFLGTPKPGIHYNRFFAWRHWRSLKDMTLQKGDVIVCLLNSVPSVVLRLPQWFLAIDSTKLLGVSKPGKGYIDIGKVMVNEKSKLDSQKDGKKCHNLGNFGFDRDEIVERALKWKGRYVYYHPFRCTPQHFVYFWLSGNPGGSARSFPHLSVNKNCKLNGLEADYTPPSNLKCNTFIQQTYGKTVYTFWNGETLVP